MADSDPFDVLAGMDAPRPLSAELRAKLEEQLLGASARPLDASLDARLTERMTDPIVALLAGLDAPRPLTGAQNRQLAAALVHGRVVRRRRAPWLAGAAAAVLVVGGLALLSTRDHPTTSEAGHPAAPRATQTLAPAAGGADRAGTTGTTGTTSGATGGGMAFTPVPQAPQPAGAKAEVPAYDAAAAVMQVAPRSGPAVGGTTVRLSGPDLQQTTSVLFGRNRADHLVVRSDGTVTVTTPAGLAGTAVDVTAVLRDGRRLVAPGGFRYT